MPDTVALVSGPSAPLTDLSLVEAARAIRRGEVTSLAYAEALLERCRAEAELNAFITLEAERVLARARDADRRRSRNLPLGPLHGVPIAVKDNINTAELPTSGGTAALRGHQTQGDATVVARLRRAGAIVLGKTGLHELSMGWTGDNPHFGPVRNPHAADRIAGGSSSGSAAAVAARMTPAALGTDTNGSIRIPAFFCGIVGYRPSIGRYPRGGVMPLAPTLDTVGLMARSAFDVALLDEVLAGPSAVACEQRPQRRLRIGIAPGYDLALLDEEVGRIFAEAIDRLSAFGIEIVTADIPGLHDLTRGTAATIIASEAPAALQAYLATCAPSVSMAALAAQLGPDIKLSSARGENYLAAVQCRTRLQEIYRRHFNALRLDALMHPVALMPAPRHGDRRVSPAPDVRINGELTPAGIAYGRNVAPVTLAGGAALVLPAGMTRDRLPVGVSLDAPSGQDAELLQLGITLHPVLGPSPCPLRSDPAASHAPVAPIIAAEKDRS